MPESLANVPYQPPLRTSFRASQSGRWWQQTYRLWNTKIEVPAQLVLVPLY
jgi:hypothetical protein